MPRSGQHDINSFSIEASQATLNDLQDRLERTRWPDSIGEPWVYGSDLAFLKSLVSYWLTEYDTEAALNRLNQLDQYTLDVAGRKLHFVHAKSPHTDALPLVLTHGWPGSFAEFEAIIPRLTHPETFGGDSTDAFHVICPSIPGYGFSDAPDQPGFDPSSVAQDHILLMQQLGYQRYGLQGGDWGSAISSWHAKLAPDAVAGLHLNLIFAPQPKDVADPLEGVSDAERARLAKSRLRMVDGTGYQAIQGSKPQTLGYGLMDSPVGLAAWIIEKFQHWTDPSKPLTASVDRDQLLTNIMIYWLSGNITASTRLYYEAAHSEANLFLAGRIETPTGHAVFPGELYLPPRAWAERQYNIQHWSIMPHGGHFAALEVPDLLADDLQHFFKHCRSAAPRGER